MSTAIQRRRGTTAQHSSFTGLSGELTVDTDKKTVVVHDGTTAGGFPLARQDLSNLTSLAVGAGTAGAPTYAFSGDTNTGLYSPGADQLALATGGSGRLFIDSSGNVNIGSPLGYSESLGVRGTFVSRVTNVANRITEAASVGYWGTATNHDLALQTNGNERLRITSAGLVGIGTSSPATALDVVGQINATTGFASNKFGINTSPLSTTSTAESFARFKTTGGDFYIGTESSTGGGFFTGSTAYAACLYNSASTPIQFFTGGTVRATLNSTGLGIGTTNPATALQVGGSSGSTASPTAITLDSTFANSDAFDKLKLYLYKDATQSYGLGLGAGADVQYWAGSSSTGVHRFFTSQTERARIDSSGRLLVGTSSSSGVAKFVVQGNTSAGDGLAIFSYWDQSPSSGTPIGALGFTDADTTKFAAWIRTERDGGTWSSTSKPGRLVFSTTADGASSPTERMRINNSGQPLFGCTSSTTVGSHTGASNVSTFNFSGITLTQYSVSAGFYYDRLNFTNAQYFVVNSSGTGVYLGNGATSWTAYSDERLKTNIVELDGAAAWEHCKAARAVTFNWKSDKYPNGQRIGFVAQDWETLYPEVITTTDENIDGVETPKGMQYTETIPVLMAALKEAIAKIETLEAKVAALEAS